MEFVIVYAKISDDKKKGVTFNGPWLGSTELTREAAERAIRKMIGEAKGYALIAKVFEVKNSNYEDAKRVADRYFERIREEMFEAKEILERPIVKRKKRRSK